MNDIFSLLSFPKHGLLELTALATFLGSEIAESFTLGNRGPAGLVWAPLSIFGAVSIIRACLSGASPGWFRQTLGFRSVVSDQAIGMDLDLKENVRLSAAKVRKRMDKALGVMSIGTAHTSSQKDIYAFDAPTSSVLNRIPETELNDGLKVFTYVPHVFKNDFRFPVFVIFSSLPKLCEMYTLWQLGAKSAGIISSIPWMYFFVSAIWLSRRSETDHANTDILAGQLPTIGQEGGTKKLMLGVAKNPKHSVNWRLMWTIGAVISAGSYILLYFILKQQSRENVFVWIAFQVFWAILRNFVHLLVQPSKDPFHDRALASLPFNELTGEMKRRVLRLVLALSTYQIHKHPRGEYSYKEDCFSEHRITKFREALNCSHYPPSPVLSEEVKVHIIEVIGDTTLSSAIWVMGNSDLTPMDLYDSCLVLFKDPSHGSFIIPAFRCLSGRSLNHPMDAEQNYIPQIIPKGSPNSGVRLTWYYWIPYKSGLWLEVATDEDTMRIIGDHVARVMTDEQLANKLAQGKLNIGLTQVKDVKKIVDISRHAAEVFYRLVN